MKKTIAVVAVAAIATVVLMIKNEVKNPEQPAIYGEHWNARYSRMQFLDKQLAGVLQAPEEGGIYAKARTPEYKAGYKKRMKRVQLNNKAGRYDHLPDKKIDRADMLYLMGSPYGIKVNPTNSWSSEEAREGVMRQREEDQKKRHQKMQNDPDVQDDIKKWIEDDEAYLNTVNDGWWNEVIERLEEDLDEAIAAGEMVPDK